MPRNVDRLSYLWLAVAAVLLPFAVGKWIIPLATWLAPVFLIRFLRTQPVGRGLLLGSAAHVLAYMLWLQGVVPGIGSGWLSGPAGRAMVNLAFSLVAYLPFAIDRMLAPRLRGFAATLVFPAAWVALEFTNALVNPMGAWGGLAYTQTGNLPLLQLVAVTGMWGVSFLIAWFAGVANWSWEHGIARPATLRGVCLYATVLSVVLLLGGARLVLNAPTALAARSPESRTVRAGSHVATLPGASGTVRVATLDGHDYRYFGSGTADERAGFVDDLFDATVREARAGARIVVWAEAVAMPPKAEEDALMARAAQVARQEQIYLVITPYVELPGEPDLAENKAVLFDPEGQVVWKHLKSRANALEGTVPGDGHIALAETPYGLVGGAICWEMDFPGYVRQAGRAGVGLMLVPAADWKQIDPMHSHMAVVRAVENGFNLVRPARGGFSAVYDYQGRVVAAMDHFLTTGDRTMVANVPTRGVRTLYSLAGDWFAWLDLALLVGLTLQAIRRSAAGTSAI